MNFEIGDIVTIKNNDFMPYTFFFIGEKDLLRRSYILYPIEKIIGPDTNYYCWVSNVINRLNLVRTSESINYENIIDGKTIKDILIETISTFSKYTKTPPLYKERNFDCTLSKEEEIANSFTEVNLSIKEVEEPFKKLKESLDKLKKILIK